MSNSSRQDSDPGLTLEDLRTPCLVLDERRMTRNIERLTARLWSRGVPLRPHLKTAKSIEVARLMMDSPAGPATVSTLKEAEQMAGAGVLDILYAVGVTPAKLDQVADIRSRGVDLSVIVDNSVQADAVAAKSRERNDRIPALIEIDSDGHRSGVRPGDPHLIEIARRLHDGGAELRGVMTHAGGSYDSAEPGAIVRMAEQERAAATACAGQLRAAGLPCPVVSVGSTPTAHFAADLTGVTEVRAGVFVFFDLVMAGLGVCAIDDIAISVLATVIGHQREKGWTLVDAGWMAMSRDRGTARQAVDQGYGLVCDIDGRPFGDLVMIEANQEHGVLALREGAAGPAPDLAVGERVRILPNHACATAAQHAAYEVVNGETNRVQATWPRISGW